MIEGLTFLDWVESDGTQHVQTDVIPGPGWGFMADFVSYNAMSGGGYGCIFGARYTSGNRDYQLTTFTTSGKHSGTLRNGGSYGSYSIDAGLTTGERCMCAFKDDTYCTPDGTETPLNTFDTPSPVPIVVFALRNSSQITQYGKVRLYMLSLFDGTDWHEFAPCEYEGVAGLYDAYNDAFLAPVGGVLATSPERYVPAGGVRQ